MPVIRVRTLALSRSIEPLSNAKDVMPLVNTCTAATKKSGQKTTKERSDLQENYMSYIFLHIPS